MQNIITNFKKSVSLNAEQQAYILSCFSEVSYKKREHLLEQNTICNYLYFIKSGCVRIYSTDDEMVENNIYFAIDDWWAVDLSSFIQQVPARFHIQALTPCTLSRIHKSNFEKLLNEIPVMEKWFRILLQNALISSENRINNKIALSAEKRYEAFLKKYPNLELQISQRHIASYLGISAEHLSKIKSRRLKTKP